MLSYFHYYLWTYVPIYTLSASSSKRCNSIMIFNQSCSQVATELHTVTHDLLLSILKWFDSKLVPVLVRQHDTFCNGLDQNKTKQPRTWPHVFCTARCMLNWCQRRVCCAYNDGDQRRVCSAYIDGEDVGITDVESFDLEPFAQIGRLIHCPQCRCFIGVDALTQVTPET